MPPIPIGSIAGLVPYKVEQAIRSVAAATGGLADQLARVPRVDTGRIDARLAAIERALTNLQRQIFEITQANASLAAQVAATSPLGPVGAGSALPSVPLPTLLQVVADYATAHPDELADSCLGTGGTWDFMDGVVAALTAADARVGFNGRRGDPDDPSEDAVAYYHGALPPVEQSLDVYVVDIIVGHCGADPRAGWNNVTTSQAAGMYLSARP